MRDSQKADNNVLASLQQWYLDPTFMHLLCWYSIWPEWCATQAAECLPHHTGMRMNGIFTLLTVMQSLSTQTRKTAGSILLNCTLSWDVCKPFNHRWESYRTLDPLFYHSVPIPALHGEVCPTGTVKEDSVWNHFPRSSLQPLLCPVKLMECRIHRGPQAGRHSWSAKAEGEQV